MNQEVNTNNSNAAEMTDSIDMSSQEQQQHQQLANSSRKRKIDETLIMSLNNNKNSSSSSSKQVQFDTQPPVMRASSCYWHDEEGLDAGEVSRRKSLIWYSRNDYQNFLKDRVATIRVYRSMQGDLVGLEDYYCLRGLEPYQSPSLHAELLAHRAVYVQAVLDQQLRDNLSSKARAELKLPSSSSEEEQQQQQHKSSRDLEQISRWAMERALRLGELDEVEAERVQKGEAVVAVPRKVGRRQSCAGSTSAVPSLQGGAKRRCLAATRRGSLPSLTNAAMNTATEILTPEYDLAKLKEMNRLLLERMCCPHSNHNLMLRQQQQQQQQQSTALNANWSTTDNKQLKQKPLSRMSLNALLRAVNDEDGTATTTTTTNTACNVQLPSLPTGRRYTALSRRLLQEQQAALKMVRRDSLCSISGHVKATP